MWKRILASISRGRVGKVPTAPTPPDIHRYFSRKELLHGREVEFPLTPALERNLTALLGAINVLREAYGKPLYISSGYRPGYYNTRVGGAPLSAHKVCMAVDFVDTDGKLKAWILANVSILSEAGLWMEDPKYTLGWLHLQVRPVTGKGGSRIFRP